MKKIEEIFYTTDIWKHFEKVADETQRNLVRNLVSNCVPVLDRIIETFPTYTLHNGQHQLNILNLYSELLGNRISELSDFETAILILSAFYHDIGMVFNNNEKKHLEKEDLFEQFLAANPTARLMLDDQVSIGEDLAEWYCRWAHAKRVWLYLDMINHELVWEGNNFRKELAQVCISHNESAEYIKSDNITSNYWNNADLKFCAIILRLCDILDFDRSRSPQSVYKYLGLDKPKSKSANTSHQEWNKHLASSGFDFGEWSKSKPYVIYFKASPNHPAVENDINIFLDVIENEIQQCRITLNSCSTKWRNFMLPEKIDRRNIFSQGYTTGSFKFDLDQKQILHLLMGESLYQNSFVFIRELLQNAIDTTKHRILYEKHIKKSNFSFKPVEFNSWHDSNGYRWIRIDDFGMGMTLEQISKYFLKVGNSFYNSDDFKVSKIDFGNDKKFTPISKFGIGILSCFIVADVIEVSTKSTYCDNKKTYPIRLSLEGIDSYFFLYTENDIPKQMPKRDGYEKTYKKEVGTSIALRLNPNFDRKEFNIHNLLERLVYCSDIPVKHVSNTYGIEQTSKYSTKLVKYKLKSEEVLQILDFLNEAEIEELNPEIHVVPIELSDKKIKNAQGILYVFLLRLNITYKPSTQSRDGYRHRYDRNNQWEFYYNVNHKEKPNLDLRINKYNKYNKDGRQEHLDIPLNHLISNLDEFNGVKQFSRKRDEILLSHNGILLPNNPNYSSEGQKFELEINELDSDCTFNLGILNLRNELRPNLDVSRSKIISFPWSFFSQINFLIRKSLRKSDYNFKSRIDYFSGYGIKIETDKKDINDDNLLVDIEGWPEEITIGDDNDIKINSLEDNSKVNLDLFSRRQYDYSDLLYKKVIFNNCKYSIKLFKEKRISPEEEESEFLLHRRAYINGKSDYDMKPFPSHIACEYENFDGLMPLQLDSGLYNMNHQFTKWLVRSYSEISINYQYFLRLIYNAESIEELNSTLDKLKKILPEEIKPNFTITNRDFEVDVENLEEWKPAANNV